MTLGRLLAALLLCSVVEAARADLVASPDLAARVEALPRLDTVDAASARINAQLADLDAEATEFGQVCDTDPPNSFFERVITVAFTGPGYLSMLEGVGFYCPGAAHPNAGVTPLTFDLQTGAEVEWRVLFPAGLLAEDTHPWPGSVKASAALVALYFGQAEAIDGECRDEIAWPPVYFRVWPDAAEHGLVLMPFSLPHSMQACADPVTIPLEVLRAEGFAPVLTEAIAGSMP